MERVCVAIGTEGLDGFSTLKWALRRWANHRIRILILHAPNASYKHYVYTPFGKLRSTSVSEDKLKLLDKTEEAKTDAILAQYIAFCGKVEAEVMKMEIHDEMPLHKQIVEAISSLGISKLVLSLAFIKASSPKSRGAISGTFYVLRNKPRSCEVFVICQGQRVVLRDEEEDDKGVTRMFTDASAPAQWENCRDEMEQYADELLSLHQVEGEMDVGCLTQLSIPQNMVSVE